MRRRSAISDLLHLALLILKLFIGIAVTLSHCIWTLLSLTGGKWDTFRSDFYAMMSAKVGKFKLMVGRLHIARIA